MKIHSKSSKLFFFCSKNFTYRSLLCSRYSCSTNHNTQCCYTVLMHWKDFVLKYKSVLTAHHEELQQNTEQKQRKVHTDGDADTETDTSTGEDQTERSFASGTLILHLGKDHLCILGFLSSYFRLHGHNVVWEREQYIIEAFLTKPVTFCFGFDLGSVQMPTSHAICVISQIKFYS